MGKFREAHKLYTEALEIDPLNADINSKLLYNRALMNSKIGNIRDAITDCSDALKTNPAYLKGNKMLNTWFEFIFLYLDWKINQNECMN